MITLSNESIALGIVPEIGASLGFLKYKGQDVLRPAPAQIADPAQAAMFVMVPYCGHITDGTFTYFGITRHVSQNDPKQPYPLNGDGWVNAWKLDTKTDNSASFIYTHAKNDPGFPFDYTAKLTYALQDNRLLITLAVKNPGKLPMPCGLGLQPYFANTHDAKLFFKTTHVWHHQNDPIFDRPYETPTEWDFKDGKPITESFDTTFGGWDGTALIQYSNGLNIKLTAPSVFRHLTLFTPPESKDCFCLEPISNTPDAFNLAALGVIDTGIQSIGPEQTFTQTIVFELNQTA